MSEASEIKERVREMTTECFWIKNMKLTDFVAFKEFSFQNTGGNYGQAIALLMKSNELEERIALCEARLDLLENKDDKAHKIKFLNGGGIK